MNRRILTLVLLAAVACSKKKDEPVKGAPATPDGTKPIVPPLPAAVAKPAADTTALWAFAPADATLGVVLGDGAGKRWLEGASGLLGDIASRPWGKPLEAKLEEGVKDARFDWRTAAGWRTVGLDLEKGSALFLDGKLGEPLLAVIPVVDRAAFRKFNEGKLETIDGREVDRFTRVVCTDAGGRYLCGRDLAVIDAAVKPHDAPLAAAVKALPAIDRGDLEFYGDLAKSPGAEELVAKVAPFGELRTVGGSARLEASGFTARGWMKGKFDGPAAALVRSIPPSPELVAKMRGATTVWWWQLSPVAIPDSDEELVPGLTLKEITRQLTGEGAAITVGSGSLGGLLMAKVKDLAAAKKLADKLCGLAESGAFGVKLEEITKTEGTCAGSIEKAAMASLKMPELKAGLAAEAGPLLTVSVGSAPTALSKWMPADMAGSPVTREILGAPATMILWSSALDVDLDALPPELTKDLDKDEVTKTVKGVIAWIASHIYEVGLAVSSTPTEVRTVFRVTTFGAEVAGARDAYDAALAKRDAKDRAGYTTAMADLEKKYPGSLVARRAEQLRAGVPHFGPVGAAVFGGAAVAYLFTKSFADSMKENLPPLEPAEPAEPEKPPAGGFGTP